MINLARTSHINFKRQSNLGRFKINFLQDVYNQISVNIGKLSYDCYDHSEDFLRGSAS
jgi:hypothetical protein